MNAEEALNLVFGEGLDGLDSGEETDIEEDPDFPLPDPLDSDCSDSAGESDPDFEPESSRHSAPTYTAETGDGESTDDPTVDGREQRRTTEGGRGRGRGRGRSRRGRGRGRGTGRRGGGRQGSRNFIPSSIPWQPAVCSSDTAPPPLPFDQQPGHNLELPAHPKPVDFVTNFLDQTVLGHIVEETNRYATERLELLDREGRMPPKSRLRKWIPLTIVELIGFLAVVINMGIINVPSLEDYWKTSWLAQIPFFSRMMSRDRFEIIFWMLHVSHPLTTPVKRIHKISSFLDMLLTRFQTKYTPHQNLAVDESMLRFRGRFVGKQYMPKKPVKWGVKTFSLADSRNGYMLNTLIYTGAETLDFASPAYASLPQPARVVMHLMSKYLSKGYHLFTDRYYTSIPLAQALHSAQTALTGTVQRDRIDLPDDIRAGVHLRGGDVKAFRAEQFMCLTWKNTTKKVPVIVVSTACSAQMKTVVSRHGRSEEKPVAVDTYNQHMNGVDILDQHSVSYPFTRKTLKWWRKVFFWLLDVSITNSYALYRDSVAKPISHVDFRRSIVESFAGQYLSSIPPRPRVGRPRKRQHSESGDPERLNGRLHLLGKREPHECVVCSNPGRGERKRSTFYCKTCTNQPALCPTGCFEAYHTKDKYRLQ